MPPGSIFHVSHVSALSVSDKTVPPKRRPWFFENERNFLRETRGGGINPWPNLKSTSTERRKTSDATTRGNNRTNNTKLPEAAKMSHQKLNPALHDPIPNYSSGYMQTVPLDGAPAEATTTATPNTYIPSDDDPPPPSYESATSTTPPSTSHPHRRSPSSSSSHHAHQQPYKPPPPMSPTPTRTPRPRPGPGYQALDAEARARLEDAPGCCCSTRGGCCFSDMGGCCFSSGGGCCFGENGGCCFGRDGGCCFSDKGGCC